MPQPAFRIEANIPEAVMQFDRLRSKQVPFATALALTTTLKDSQTAVRARLRTIFTLRTPWLEREVRIEPARKDRLEGAIKHRFGPLRYHEEGATKRPQGTALAIPSRVLRQAAPRGVIRGRRRPREILRQRNVYVDSAKGQILRRRPRGQAPQVLYVFTRSAWIKPGLEFAETTGRTFARRWPGNFGKALGKALATQRI